jgi:hypothetical protein
MHVTISNILVRIIFIWLFSATNLFGQLHNDIQIEEKQVMEAISILSSDAMAGRQTFSKEIKAAANFIADEFSKAGLQPLSGEKKYLQIFHMVRSSVKDVKQVTVGTEKIDITKIIAQVNTQNLKITHQSGYQIIRVNEGENAMAAFRNIRNQKKNTIALMHTSHEPFFGRLKQNNSPRMVEGAIDIIYLLTNNPTATEFHLEFTTEIEKLEPANIVGYLPGKTKPDEFVIFSGHYDHIGIGRPDENGDSIYNGANDDASGTTAVIALAHHFSKQNNNERSLIFAAFTGEEVGGFGSRYFSQKLDPEKIVAMFNIEMIGTDSKWGLNSAYITGFDKTNMGEILQRNLSGTGFQFHPDPYPQQNLFYRSDNATLARLGVPAHTISTSKMDIEPHYHKPSDEVSTLDIKNMTQIIKAIAISSSSLVSGLDTPSRVDNTQLRQ